MKVGYARVSTHDQNLDLQLKALTDFGCEKIFSDKISGAAAERDGLAEAIAFCRTGDQFVVWKLDRLGRSLKHLIEVTTDLASDGVDFVAIDNQLDTSSPAGKLLFHIMACFAEFERNLIQERTIAGVNCARNRGVRLGRPQKITPDLVDKAGDLIEKHLTITEVCQVLGISRTSFYNQINPLLLSS